MKSPLRPRSLHVAEVEIPTEIPNTTAIFIALRRLRTPLLAIITIMTVGIIGLSLLPGIVQEDGSSGRLSAFEAFYVFSTTATTIGFGEIPHEFSIYQRWWVVFFVYVSVMGWAYMLARVMSLMQDSAFQSARAAQSVRRTINHMREPFVIIAGYGYTGRSVAKALDRLGRRIVVLDEQELPIERLATDMLSQEVPGITGDACNPATLGLAGLGHHNCEAVLALTGDEEINLQIVMNCSLLRPDIPVIARAATPRIVEAMEDFHPQTIINPFDDFGNVFVLALKHPYVYRLITWLIAQEGTALPPIPRRAQVDRWLVISDDPFGEQIANDLRREKYDVAIMDPRDDHDFTDFQAVIAGAASDTANLALAAHVRHSHPEIFLVVRQRAHSRLPLLDAFLPDFTFFPPQVISERTMANLVSPRMWEFVKSIMELTDSSAQKLTNRIVDRVGPSTPRAVKMTIGEKQTPAIERWLQRGSLRVGDLFHSAQDSSQHISAMPIMIVRDQEVITLPEDDEKIFVGDEVLMIGTHEAFDDQSESLHDDSTLYYTVTGVDIPTSRAWRFLTGRHMIHPIHEETSSPATEDTSPATQP
ncbi:MAG: NAD-binding protein [Propionibacteriaceae bacterium]|nr:NAD-binding protein [Propionibacteriaceae bacterium]